MNNTGRGFLLFFLLAGTLPGTVFGQGSAALAERVVYYDAKYDSNWIEDPESLSRYFSRRGFVAKNALELGLWMKDRVVSGAPGTVVVLTHDIAPESILDRIDRQALVRRYLDAGGRVVWIGDIPLYNKEGETGFVRNSAGSFGEAGRKVLDVGCDEKLPRNRSAVLTEDGKRWGLRASGSLVRPVLAKDVTISLSGTEDMSGIWLKNYNRDYPYSGFVCRIGPLDGEAGYADIYRLALYSGTPVSVPDPTPEVKRRPDYEISVLPDSRRTQFLRGEVLRGKVWIRNNTDRPVEPASVRIKLLHGDQPVWNMSRRVKGETPVEFAIPTGTLAFGEYIVRATFEGETKSLAIAEHRVGIRRLPERKFSFAIWTGMSLKNNPYRYGLFLGEMEKTKMDFVCGGNAKLADMALAYGRKYLNIWMPETAWHRWSKISARRGAKGEGWPDPWMGGAVNDEFLGLSAPGLWKDAGEEIQAFIREQNEYPSFSHCILTSDDFSARAGWDWSENNTRRFKELCGREAPVPVEFQVGTPPYGRGMAVARKTGIVPETQPWLLWSAFLCRDVLGAYNRTVMRAALAVDPKIKIGPVPGDMQWPVFQLSTGQYPPFGFGENGLNLLSYYCYEGYAYPSIVYTYWSEAARLGKNRDLPLYVTADAGYCGKEPSYLRNNFYLMLAGGARGINYYSYEPYHFPEAVRPEMKNLAGSVDRYGDLWAGLKPKRKRAGLLMSFTTACFHQELPLELTYAYANLLLAHVDVVPISEEEIIDGDLSGCEAILLCDIDWLREKAADGLKEYIRKGGRVIADRHTEIDIPGMERIPLSFIKGRETGEGYGPEDYGDKRRIAEIKEAVAAVVPPVLESPAANLIIRSFQAEGVDYLWLVNVHTGDEYRFIKKKIGLGAVVPDEADALEEVLSFMRNDVYGKKFRTKVRVTGEVVQCLDIPSGRELRVSRIGEGREQWSEFEVEMERLGGTLIALYRTRADRILLEGPGRLRRGRRREYRVSITDVKGRPQAGLQPIEIEVMFEGSQLPYGRHTVAENGRYVMSLDCAVNDPAGSWTIKVTNLATRQTTTKKISVQ